MAIKTLSFTDISRFLNKQQEKVYDIDKAYPIRKGDILLALKKENSSNEHIEREVINHIFSNIRHSHQDAIILCEGLLSKPHYTSSTLGYITRESTEALIDLGYIITDLKEGPGEEYLRFAKFIYDTINNCYEENNFKLSKDRYNNLFPPHLTTQKRNTQWTNVAREQKIEKGLELLKVIAPALKDAILKLFKITSAVTHGNLNNNRLSTQTSESLEPLKMKQISSAITYSEGILNSGLKCYQIYSAIKK